MDVPQQKNYTAKRGNRLRRSLLISLAKELAGLQDENAIQIPASSPANTRKRKRCSMCLPKADRKTKTFLKHAIAIFGVIILSLFAESVTTNNHKLFRICLHCIIVTHTFVYHVFSAGINTYMNYVQCTSYLNVEFFLIMIIKTKHLLFITTIIDWIYLSLFITPKVSSSNNIL